MITYKITDQIRNEILTLADAGASSKQIAAHLSNTYGYGKSKAYGSAYQVLGRTISSKRDTQKVQREALIKSITLGNATARDPIAEDTYKAVKARDEAQNQQADLLEVYGQKIKEGKITPLPFEMQLEVKDDVKWDSGLEFKEKYVYNEKDDKYIFASNKAKSGYIVLSGNTIRSLQYDYTNGLTLVDIARKYQIPRVVLTEVYTSLGVTHNSLPFTTEEISGKDLTQLSVDLLEKKKFEFHQSLEKQMWKETQTNATKWIEFEYGQLKPFEQAIAKWVPPVYTPMPIPARKFKKDRAFVAGVFDWHVGGAAEARYLFKGKEWNIEVAKKMVHKYIAGIKAKVVNDPVGYDKCVILMGGDLYNTLTGFTSNGTPLLNDKTKDTQFDAIMDCLVLFINEMLSVFQRVEAHFVRGNHGGTTDYPLGVALKSYFRTEPRLEFNLYSCRTASVKVNEVLILLDHGASDQTKSMMPRNGKARESYVQHLLLSHPEWLVGIKQRLFIMGDLHHFNQEEHADFEFIQMGALVVGDQYSDTKNLHNRPRQNCLEIDDEGLVAMHHIYME